MILNHQAAIELLVADIEHVGFDRYTVMSLHSALAENLLPNPLVVEELQRLHEGVLARYGLRPAELAAWKAGQAAL